MKKIRCKLGFYAFIVASLSLGTVCSAEETGMADEAETEGYMTEEAAFSESKMDLQPFIVEFNNGEVLTIQNESGILIENAKVDGVETKESEMRGESTTPEETVALTLISKDGEDHIFEDFPVHPVDPVLISDDGFLFLKYKDSDGNSVYAYETADEVTFDKPKTKYITDRVYIRSEPNQDSEILGIAELGSEVRVYAAQPKWCYVESGDIKGYVGRARITPLKGAAEAAVAQEEAARAEIAAAAARAAAQASSGSGGNSVVSRQWVEDCDGSGNGYYIVTHSNGSVTYENG